MQAGAQVLINASFRHGDTTNFPVFGLIVLAQGVTALTLENGNVFGHGFEP